MKPDKRRLRSIVSTLESGRALREADRALLVNLLRAMCEDPPAHRPKSPHWWSEAVAWQYYVRVEIAGEKSDAVIRDLIEETGASRSQILYARKHYADQRLVKFIESLDPKVAADAARASRTKGRAVLRRPV